MTDSIAEPDQVHQSRQITAQRASLWLAPIFGVFLLVAFVTFPGFFPPMPPDMTAEQVAAFFGQHAVLIRFSMIIYNICGVMFVPFFMVIVVHMKRMATPSQVLAYSYLTAAANSAMLFAISDLLWLIAAFRPDRSPDIVQLLNDMAWIIFTAPVGGLMVMMGCLALAIFLDARTRPIFPRWVAYLNIVTALAMAPSACAAIVQTGPLAWNGFVSFWLRIGAFTAYLAVMFVVVRAAIQRQAEEEHVQPTPVPPEKATR